MRGSYILWHPDLAEWHLERMPFFFAVSSTVGARVRVLGIRVGVREKTKVKPDMKKHRLVVNAYT